jgi:hypothetical protein
VLKALSFAFEHIGAMGKDCICAVAALLEDALVDYDAVHRQTDWVVVKHLAPGVAGLGCEDAMIHLLNFVCGLHAAGSVPPRMQGAGDLLEDLQHAAHGRPLSSSFEGPGARVLTQQL